MLRNRLSHWLLSTLTFFFLAPSLFATQTEVRAAIDFGSGAVKMQVSRVDCENHCIVGEPLIQKHVSLNLTEDIATHGGQISEAMASRALDILRQLKQEACSVASEKGSKVKFAGVATAAFRKAVNGIELLHLFEKQLDLTFHHLSQEEESQLGFMTAKAVFPEVDEKKLIAWDSGNGSFQLSINQEGLKTYHGPLGYGTVRVILSRDIRNGPVFQPHESGNPVKWEEAKELDLRVKALLPKTPEWLNSKLKSNETVVATFGEGKSLFPVIAESLAALENRKEPVEIITRADLKEMCTSFLEQDDELFDSMGIYNRTSSASVFLLAMMEHLGIEEFHFKKAVGNTSGILISPQFWSP